MTTHAVCFPFDLFGSAGTGQGARLLADALREMLADSKRETRPARGRTYAGRVRLRELAFDTLAAYQDWRPRGRRLVRRAFAHDAFLLWLTGNHLGALPVYEELTAAPGSLIVQFDAHLDLYHLHDCTAELSHGNFLRHLRPLPAIVNVGHRDLFLPADEIAAHFQHAFSAARLATDSDGAVRTLQQLCAGAKRVFLDIDCDVFDPAFFPAVTYPLPFGLAPPLVLRLIEAARAGPVAGVAVSEFEPGRDRADQSLALLVWLLEYLLLRHYEDDQAAERLV